MKKKFMLEGLDCAHCAEKLEAAVKNIDGVNDASVSFLTLKLMIEADDDKFDAVVGEAVKVAAKVVPDAKIVL